MLQLTFEQVASLCGGTLECADAQRGQFVTSVTTDSRKCGEGSLFVPIVGARMDGHDYIGSARALEAALIITAREDTGSPCVRVEDTLIAFQKLAAGYRQLFDIPVVGITGSVGKTTTKEMVSCVLGARFVTHKSQGNLNNHLGVPMTLMALQPDHEAAVVEMGTNHFGEIAVLAQMAKPDICLFTNIGDCHLEFLGSREGVFKAKTEMLDYMRAGGRIVANGADPILRRLGEREDCLLYGFDEACRVRAENVEPKGMEGSAFTLVLPGERVEAFVPAAGEHMVLNALAAAAAGHILGMTAEQIVTGLAAYAPVGSRMRTVTVGGVTVIDDSYNASPAAVKAAVGSLKGHEGRKVAVLGDMFELGENAAALHKEVGEAVAKMDVQLVVTVGELARHISDAAAAQGVTACHFPDKQGACAALPALVKVGDCVLIKASHGMQLGEVAQHLIAALENK